MSERYQIRMMPRASEDIIQICSYIERDSSRNAARVAQRLLNAIDSLELLPHRYRVHEHRRNPAKTVHSMPVSPFIVYYRVVDAKHIVEILAVLHGSRRQPRQFR